MALPPVAGGPAAPPAEMPAGDPMLGDEAAGPVVVCKIVKNPDGSFLLVEGDGPIAPEAPIEGEAPMDPAAAEPMGQTFDSAGPLLKGVLDLVQGSDPDDAMGTEFSSGFNGDTPPAAPKA